MHDVRTSSFHRARLLAVGVTVAILASGCQAEPDADSDSPGRAGADATPAVIAEAFVTDIDTLDNVDSPAVWHGPNGEHWVLSTAKEADVILVHDASTGALISRAAGPGTGAGQLERPNGIAVIGDMALVVERDNHRVQGFTLPGMEPMGSFGEEVLVNPYGIAWYEHSTGSHSVFVTDNYEMPDESVPPDDQLGERVKEFRVSVADGRLSAEHVRSLGETSGEGVVRIVESVMVDPGYNRLFIAEEDETDSHWKVYDLDSGRFRSTMGRGQFPQQAEGMALYACDDRAGYWIATDQGDEINTFLVFDRESLELVGAFRGEVTNTTDGVALTQQSFGRFPSGAFYTSHYDAAISAFDWEDVASALGLGCS